MAKAKLTRDEEKQLKIETEQKRKEMIRQKEMKERKIQTEYDTIIRVINQSARKLKDDELDELNNKLKRFFNSNTI